VIEAADAIGMTRAQRLRLVEAPLAAPVAMAGVRTAAVWTIGAATLSTTVGYPSLGNLIFAGLQTETTALVLVGCVAAAGLALAADALLGLIEGGVARGRRMAVLVPVALILAGGCRRGGLPVQTGTAGRDDRGQELLRAICAGRADRHAAGACGLCRPLPRGAGLPRWRCARWRPGDVDVYVDYAGTIWTNAMQRRDTRRLRSWRPGVDRWLQGA
jgi:osmoprotectant transport system permease protein